METKKEDIKLLKLSIQVRLDGLSFCILNCRTKEIVWYKKQDFPKEYNPVKILEKIAILYQNEKVLQSHIGEVVLLFSNDLYSLVPEAYFIEEEASNYLKFNTKILKTDVVAHDSIANKQLVNVYIPYANIINYFFDKYGEFEYKHGISVLTEAVLEFDSGEGTTAYLNNFTDYFDLVVVKNNKLLLCNTFSYDTKEDFIYYLLFTAEQLELDPSQFELCLLGDISNESPLYAITYTYIKNIRFLEPGFEIHPEDKNTGEFQREAFILLKSLKCE
ncbi:MAG TPA: DUF3822 family protein [Gillisia sp.]|nr:DUF3822 family protein [Gillisia sp.]